MFSTYFVGKIYQSLIRKVFIILGAFAMPDVHATSNFKWPCYHAKSRNDTPCLIWHKSNELDEPLYSAQTEWSKWLCLTAIEPIRPRHDWHRKPHMKNLWYPGYKLTCKADQKPRMQNLCHSESDAWNFKTHKAGNTSIFHLEKLNRAC